MCIADHNIYTSFSTNKQKEKHRKSIDIKYGNFTEAAPVAPSKGEAPNNYFLSICIAGFAAYFVLVKNQFRSCPEGRRNFWFSLVLLK